MPEFILPGKESPEFNTLDPFTQGYIEAMFFTDGEQLHLDGCGNGTFLADSSEAPCFGDLAPEALATIILDCATFQAANRESLEVAYSRAYDAAQAGRDYWFTRNRHGVGFWDRKELEPDSEEYERLTAVMMANQGDREVWGQALAARKIISDGGLGEILSKACRHSEVNTYVGDDGKVYL